MEEEWERWHVAGSEVEKGACGLWLSSLHSSRSTAKAGGGRGEILKNCLKSRGLERNKEKRVKEEKKKKDQKCLCLSKLSWGLGAGGRGEGGAAGFVVAGMGELPCPQGAGGGEEQTDRAQG